MKLFLISQIFYPDQVSTANLYTDLCSVIAGDGIEVEVWAAHPSYSESGRQPSSVYHKGIIIRYLPSTNFRKLNLAGRLVNMITFTISICLKILISSDRTPVWTHTTSPFVGILLSHLCRMKKRKFIYILLDIFPEGLIRVGKVSGNNPLIRIWHKMFMNSLRRSEKIIVLGRDMKKWVSDSCNQCHNKIIYIPHWQSDTLISPVEFGQSKFVEKNGLRNKFVIQYSGNMGLWNELAILGKAVNKKMDDTVFLFAGNGIRKDELLNEIKEKNRSDVIFIPFQPNEIFNDVLCASHVHLVTLREKLEGMAVPSKIYGILAAGRPVIAMVPNDSEIAYLVREENCGFVLAPSDLDGLIEAMVILKTDEQLRKSMQHSVSG